jgi:hypothetical protein
MKTLWVVITLGVHPKLNIVCYDKFVILLQNNYLVNYKFSFAFLQNLLNRERFESELNKNFVPNCIYLFHLIFIHVKWQNNDYSRS